MDHLNGREKEWSRCCHGTQHDAFATIDEYTRMTGSRYDTPIRN
jgi:hypothetical protein